MNITKAFADWMVINLGLTLGQDLFVSQAPSSNKVVDGIWWIVASGGNVDSRSVTGENVKIYSVQIFYRSRDHEDVYNTLQVTEEQINCSGCLQLDGYETLDVMTSFLGIDDDLDQEDRKVGLLQTDITIKQEC